jgi:hypothetical protein
MAPLYQSYIPYRLIFPHFTKNKSVPRHLPQLTSPLLGLLFSGVYCNFYIAGKKNGENQKVSAILAATGGWIVCTATK